MGKEKEKEKKERKEYKHEQFKEIIRKDSKRENGEMERTMQ